MRKILLLLLLINSFQLFAQYEDKWKEVYQYELDGKVKSAQETNKDLRSRIEQHTYHKQP